MFPRPKILFLVSLLFVALLNPKFNPYLLFKFLIFYRSSNNIVRSSILMQCCIPLTKTATSRCMITHMGYNCSDLSAHI